MNYRDKINSTQNMKIDGFNRFTKYEPWKNYGILNTFNVFIWHYSSCAQ